MLTKFFFLATLFTLSSCGDSPFLQKKGGGETPAAISSSQALSSALTLKEKSYQIQFYWRTGPVVFDESTMLILVTDQRGVPVDPTEKLGVMIWMPSMGHGSYPVTVERVGLGLYEVTEIYFIMDGYWDLHFQLSENGKVIDQVTSGLTL